MQAGDVVADKYRLRKQLGVGGMGEVWSAEHIGTGREFAIKLMAAHSATSESARQRFAREARASAKINHPNIIDVFDVGALDDGSLYLVMELLDGMSLGDAFFAEPPLSAQALVALMLEASKALAAAHAAGIIHRDIKPPNIFLHRDRTTGLASAKLLDFGISKFSTNEDSFTTKTGSVLGSPRYMSPEQTRSSAAADHRSDIWAMGVVLFEALTGEWPHDGDSFSSLVVAIATQPPKSIDTLAPHVPDELRSIVRDCLVLPDRRIQVVNELAARLESALADPALVSISLPKPVRRPGDSVRSTTGLRVRIPAFAKTPPPRPTPTELFPAVAAAPPARTSTPHQMQPPPQQMRSDVTPASWHGDHGSYPRAPGPQPAAAISSPGDHLTASIGGMDMDSATALHSQGAAPVGAPPPLPASNRSRRALGIAATAAAAAAMVIGIASLSSSLRSSFGAAPGANGSSAAATNQSVSPVEPTPDAPEATVPAAAPLPPSTPAIIASAPAPAPSSSADASKRPAAPARAGRAPHAGGGKTGSRVDQLGSGL